jgi:hypothetical protein
MYIKKVDIVSFIEARIRIRSQISRSGSDQKVRILLDLKNCFFLLGLERSNKWLLTTSQTAMYSILSLHMLEKCYFRFYMCRCLHVRCDKSPIFTGLQLFAAVLNKELEGLKLYFISRF